MAKYQIIEEFGAKLHLAVFDENDKVTYLNSSYTEQRGSLTKALEGLLAGQNPITHNWQGNFKEPQKIYDSIVSHEFTWKVIGDNDGIYPELMKDLANNEFSYQYNNEIVSLSDAIKQLKYIEFLLEALNLADFGKEDFDPKDFGVYMTTRYFAVIRDFTYESPIPWCCGRPEKIIAFLKNLINTNEHPDNPYQNDWIFNRIQETIEDPKSGVVDYDAELHGYGIDGLTACPPLKM